MGEPYQSAGIWIYPEKPEEIRLARKPDLIDSSGQPRYGRWILIHRETDNFFESMQIRPGFDYEYWRYWLIRNRMYVKES